jgi:hypothetical protein
LQEIIPYKETSKFYQLLKLFLEYPYPSRKEFCDLF